MNAGGAIALLHSLDQTSDFCLSDSLGAYILRKVVRVRSLGSCRWRILRKAELSRWLVLERLPVLGDDFAFFDSLFLGQGGCLELKAAPMRGTSVEPARPDRAARGRRRNQHLIRLLTSRDAQFMRDGTIASRSTLPWQARRRPSKV